MVNFYASDVIKRLFIIYSVKNMKELAAAMEIGSSTVSGWNVKNSIPFEVLLDVVDKHNVSMDWLIYGKEQKAEHDVAERMMLEAFKVLDDKQKMQAIVLVGNLANAGLTSSTGVSQTVHGSENNVVNNGDMYVSK